MILLSPSKIMNMESATPDVAYSVPIFLQKANKLVIQLQKLKDSELANLLNTSSKLAKQSFGRYATWLKNPVHPIAKPSIHVYHGEVYNGLQAHSFHKDELLFSQKHVRILSGLYGILRPLDLIQAHRLDVSSPFKTASSGNLYDYWSTIITRQINKELTELKSDLIINLASQEYFKMLNLQTLKSRNIISPVFMENSPKGYKIVTVYAKKARGMMTRFIVQNKITDSEYLKAFDMDGYCFNHAMSDETHLVFTRR